MRVRMHYSRAPAEDVGWPPLKESVRKIDCGIEMDTRTNERKRVCDASAKFGILRPFHYGDLLLDDDAYGPTCAPFLFMRTHATTDTALPGF
jgi:hypothetical protein